MIRVLVVDDDFMVAKVHSGFVDRTPGFCVVGVAHTGSAALEAIRELQPDVVLLDVYMPDMTGLDVLRHVRAAAGPERSVDVVVVTAASDVASVEQARQAGVVTYLVKPFHYDDLRQRLEHVADVRRKIGELAQRSRPHQQDIDHLFAAAARPAAPSTALPKGLSPETALLVQTVLREAGEGGISATECGERTGLSRVSARRYLEHLSATGRAQVRAKYGRTGRPERRYTAS